MISTSLSNTSKKPRGLSALRPSKTDRALFVGQTGSGKTTLARRLLAFEPFVVVHDGKGTLNWAGYTLARSWREVQQAARDPLTYPRLIYRPTASELDDDALQDAFFEWVLDRGRTTLYVDEVFALVERGGSAAAFRACVTRGRETGVSVWSATQRPTMIPLVILSETEHAYLFRLQLEEDRRRIAKNFSVDEDSLSSLDKQYFYYARLGEAPSGPHRLQLAA